MRALLPTHHASCKTPVPLTLLLYFVTAACRPLQEIKSHPFYEGVDWAGLHACSAPYVHTYINTLAPTDP
jgi:hypothetical protein